MGCSKHKMCSTCAGAVQKCTCVSHTGLLVCLCLWPTDVLADFLGRIYMSADFLNMLLLDDTKTSKPMLLQGLTEALLSQEGERSWHCLEGWGPALDVRGIAWDVVVLQLWRVEGLMWCQLTQYGSPAASPRRVVTRAPRKCS